MHRIIRLIKKLLRKSRTKHQPIDANYVIPRSKHPISKTDISANALKVLNRLNSEGFEAYLVGGSVRDLLLHKSPKDFDVATNATPNQVRNLFRNARIIGRRFKLVHVLFHREIIEVATFRGSEAAETNQLTNERGMLVRDNAYGTLEEDAWRRDFTINSLYYNINDFSIVDFTGGVQDIALKTLRMIGDPLTRYQEDPVRMLRAIRFSAKLHFQIAKETAEPIKEHASLITHVSNSRLFDEITKLYQCGEGKQVQTLLNTYGVFPYLFPQTARLFESTYPAKILLEIALESTDTRIHSNKPVTPAFLFAVILWFPMLAAAERLKQQGVDPLPAIEQAMSMVIAEQNKIISIPKRFSQVVREIWIMQYRFPKRTGNRAMQLLEHPRFRAAYDFLALRALAGDESIALAQWWDSFQEADTKTQYDMITEVSETAPTNKKPRKKRTKKPVS